MNAELYYNDPQEKKILGDDGTLDVDAVINGLPKILRLPGQVGVPKPKKLILSDWSASVWPQAKRAAMIQKLSTMMDEGFEVYVLQNEEMVSLTKANLNKLSDLDFCTQITPKHPDEALKLASKTARLPRDKLFLLDDHGVNAFLKDEHTSKLQRKINLSDVYAWAKKDLDPEHNSALKGLLEILSNTTPPLSCFMNDLDAEIKIQAFQDFIKTHYPHIMIDSSERLFLENLDERNFAIPESLGHVKRLRLQNCTLNATQLENLLKNTPLLEKLELYNCTIHGDFSSELWHLSQLKEFNMSGEKTNIGTMLFENLMSRFPETMDVFNFTRITMKPQMLQIVLNKNLRVVNMLGCKGLASSDLTKLKSNSSLIGLSLAFSDVKFTQVTKLLSDTPFLNVLILKDCSLQDEMTSVTPAPEHLRVITLEKAKISPQNFTWLLSNTAELRCLCLIECHVLSYDFEIPPNALSGLEVIQVDANFITPKQIETILNNAPNLKEFLIVGTLPFQLEASIKARIDAINQQEVPQDLLPYLEFNPSIKSNKTYKITDSSEKESLTIVPPKENTQDAQEFKDPIHDVSSKKHIKPGIETAFSGENKTKNQGMIIQKFIQYLILNKQERLISKIQGGMCDQLSHYFLDLDKNTWDGFIDLVSTWDGNPPIHKALNEFFNDFHKNYFRLKFQNKNQYLGDNLNLFLSKINPHEGILLSNPWHMISLKRQENGFWDVYDPNWVAGHRLVADEELLGTLHQTLGPLILTQSNRFGTKPRVDHIDSFLEEGGLLALHIANNSSSLITQLLTVDDFSKNALDGILLRDEVRGIPAWVLGIRNKKLRKLTNSLLTQFIQKNPTDWKAQLEESLECLLPQEKAWLIESLVKAHPELKVDVPADTPVVSEVLIPIVRKVSPLTTYFERHFQTWDKITKKTTEPALYCAECLQDTYAKRLIQLSSGEEVHRLLYALQTKAIHEKRPVFYVHSSDDLICSKRWIERTKDDIGIMHDGPGGPLHTFLKNNEGQRPLILVNYDAFSPDDLVKFNALLDDCPNADGTPLPLGTQVIGLINMDNPEVYQGSDFYSRFDERDKQPLSPYILETMTPTLPIPSATPLEVSSPTLTPCIIDLYHQSHWKELLLGRWKIHKNELKFEEGPLKKALQSKQPIEIRNGLWDDPEFKHFFEQAYITQNINQIPFAKDTTLIFREGYDWQALLRGRLHLERGFDVKAPVINPSRIERLYANYSVVDEQLLTEAGYIATIPLVLNLTRTLSDDEWARLLANYKGSELKIYVAPGVKLPTSFDEIPEKPLEKLSFSHTLLIKSTDPDATIARQVQNGWIPHHILDVSECTPSDLFLKMDSDITHEHSMLFKTRASFLKTELQLGKNIVLKGKFSKELADELASFLLEERSLDEVKGKLLLVSDDALPFPYHQIEHQIITAEDKANLLQRPLPHDIEEHLETNTYTQLLSRQQGFGDASWAGLSNEPIKVPKFKPLNIDTASEDVKTFLNERRKAVKRVLETEPYVYLSGLSGVGKTSFVLEEFCKKEPFREHEIEAWANTSFGDGNVYLFIDEANITHKQWSEFEGLFHKPPSIFIHGKKHVLTEKHKVIFAGNPVSYGDERQLAPIFHQHGNAILFSPLPLCFIYEKILGPIFEGTGIDEAVERQIKVHLIKVYETLCGYSTTDILISPRELEMIGLIIRSKYLNQPTMNAQELMSLSKNITYDITAQLVPENNKIEFERKFQPSQPPVMPKSANKEKTFLFTSSRQRMRQAIEDRLALRHLRRTQPGNAKQQSGGIGGQVFEGEPGEGKSETLIATLLDNGFVKREVLEPLKKLSGEELQQKYFYHIPASMDIETKKKWLLHAFHEGSVVVMDEINSCPMMERFLNGLLMGRGPKGESPMNPGFMLLGTQNPITMAGRRLPSTALSRRLTLMVVPNYTREEMQEILEFHQLSPKVSKALIEAFEEQRNRATKHHLSPPPTFRDLLKLAKAIQHHHQKDYLECASWIGDIIKMSPPKEILEECMEIQSKLLETQPLQYHNIRRKIQKLKENIQMPKVKDACVVLLNELRKTAIFGAIDSSSNLEANPNRKAAEPLLLKIQEEINQAGDLYSILQLQHTLKLLLERSVAYDTSFHWLRSEAFGWTVQFSVLPQTEEMKRDLLRSGKVVLSRDSDGLILNYLDERNQNQTLPIDSPDLALRLKAHLATGNYNDCSITLLLKDFLMKHHLKARNFTCQIKVLTPDATPEQIESMKEYRNQRAILQSFLPVGENNPTFIKLGGKLYITMSNKHLELPQEYYDKLKNIPDGLIDDEEIMNLLEVLVYEFDLNEGHFFPPLKASNALFEPWEPVASPPNSASEMLDRVTSSLEIQNLHQEQRVGRLQKTVTVEETSLPKGSELKKNLQKMKPAEETPGHLSKKTLKRVKSASDLLSSTDEKKGIH